VSYFSSFYGLKASGATQLVVLMQYNKNVTTSRRILQRRSNDGTNKHFVRQEAVVAQELIPFSTLFPSETSWPSFPNVVRESMC